ncbi:S9 family peptidase [Planosporangium flavigriseum]|uniref:Peptidase S9 n=1 Tax=Planosporangium flavigriseum TaxID=373681 RepID=A0A8J3LQQ7_9ACTN|nr:prolyl oligopeptidase family serine peptidase [Planosporangium flavigriseum]NJC66113.1 S9 family peptidase [Planosporangium flavigriseum]GIG76252.1 peptidase S9 [Planosporangium flavigriseum]
MIVNADSDKQPADPFSDLDAYVGRPRVGGLWLSPDGRRLVVGVATLDRKKTRYTTALWEVDPDGARPARRLTRSSQGEAAAAFTPAGDLLFVSSRPEPDGDADEEPRSSLWLQPATGGDARVVASPPGGVRGVVVSAAGTVVLGSGMMPSAADAAGDKEIRAKRKEAGVSAILHEEYPVRRWDHDLGPDRTRLLVADLTEDVTTADARLELRDVTGPVGRAFDDECSWDITPDGRTVVTVWAVAEPGGSQRYTLVAIDVATGERRTLADEVDHEYNSPRVSPDGTRVAVVVERRSTADDPGDHWLGIVPLTGGPVQALTHTWDRWPHSAQWMPDGTALIVAADDHGRSPLWRVDAATGRPTRLTDDDGAYTDIRVSPDGRWVYALRAAIDSPPAPVRIALDGASAHAPLPGPVEALGVSVRVPGRLEEVTTTAEDGTPLRAWIALPQNAGADSPVPLLLWIHGGPLHSWNAWSWRWNPWIAVAHGYAVLLPDPALSTGYGIDFIRRGWGAWGGAPYTDLMALTDAAQERPDVDAARTGAMGGSFGGYMANWVAGHTDRFAAIVTHASLWALDQMSATTDGSYYWVREMTREMTDTHSPHRFAEAIATPMLVIHGDKDYRVPIGEALRLWWDLLSRSKAEDGSSPHKFLYFPDENHWVLKPGHAKLWYATVLAFLAHHVLGEDWQRPSLLG